MLKISSSQREAFNQDARRRFHVRVVTWLHKHAPEGADKSDYGMNQLIERQEKVAARYGLTSERDIAKWCYLALITAERFDGLAEVKNVLTDGRVTPDRRLDTILVSLAAVLNSRSRT